MRTFSESWHRVRDVRPRLRPQVRAHRQHFRGEAWHVLHDPMNNQFFRVRPGAYALLARLDGRTTVHAAWEAEMEADPEGAPGQQDVVELLGQLYTANLLQSELPADAVALFERHRKRRRREVSSKLLAAMFARFPLWDPDDFLRRALPLANLVLNRFGLAAWAVVVLLGLRAVVDDWPRAVAQAGAVLAPDNLALLFAGTFVLKLLHEAGHAFLCRKFGGEVHTFGVMLMILTPMPYVDATSAWSLRRRRERLLVGAGGMLVELFCAGLAALVWSATGPGVVNTLAYNLMFAASVSTLLFNLNPLLRFDGYFLLVDAFGLPNLYQRSLRHLRHLVERRAFAVPRERPIAADTREAWWLTTYGIAGGAYRIVLFASIAWFVSQQWLLVGLAIGVFCVFAWVVVPLGKLAAYLATSPKLHRVRARATGVTLAAFAVPVLALALVPAPQAVRVAGRVRAAESSAVVTGTQGRVAEVLVPSGASVAAGQALVRLEDPDLAHDLARLGAQVEELRARERQALGADGTNLRLYASVLRTLEARRSELETRRDALVVRARHAGVWVSPRESELGGRWVARGSALGEVIDTTRFVFEADLPTAEARGLLGGDRAGAGLRVAGQVGRVLGTEGLRVVPAAREATEAEERESGSTPPAFAVRADIVPDPEVALHHGIAGVLRVRLAPEPLLTQWLRRIRREMQGSDA